MGSHVALTYVSSEAIKTYCGTHPVVWGSREIADDGNVLTPTPAMALFFRLFSKVGGLFTQEEYRQFAFQEWADWIADLPTETRRGIAHRLYRNFYPSAIDSLHVWALLVESGRFDRCTLDTADDAMGKTDVSVWPMYAASPVKIALYAGTHCSVQRTEYKRTHRGGVPLDTIDVVLSMDRPKYPGGKRWYEIADLEPVFDRAVDMLLSRETAS